MKSEVLVKVAKNELFSKIDIDILTKLGDNIFMEKKFNTDEIIIKQDTYPDNIYLIVSGKAAIIKHDTIEENYQISHVLPNQYVGEISILNDMPHSATVKAITPVETIMISKENFFYLLNDIPQISINLVTSMSKRILISDQNIIFNIHKSEIFRNLNDQIMEQAEVVKKLNEELRKYANELRLKNKELAKKNKELYKLSITDMLTEVYNRNFLIEFLKKLFNQRKKDSITFSCIMIDIDDFKKVNDTYGHFIGDYVLKNTAKIINDTIRRGDIVARYGGEEFMIILFETDIKKAKIVAEKIRLKIQNYNFICKNQKINVTISLGVTDNVIASPENEDQLFIYADKALYKAKEVGKNRVIGYDCLLRGEIC